MAAERCEYEPFLEKAALAFVLVLCCCDVLDAFWTYIYAGWRLLGTGAEKFEYGAISYCPVVFAPAANESAAWTSQCNDEFRWEHPVVYTNWPVSSGAVFKTEKSWLLFCHSSADDSYG